VPPGRHRGGPRALGLVVLLAGVALGLSACSGADGQSLARQACVHVDRSISDWVLATKASTPAATASHLEDEADQELRAALPLAAAANSDDGSWNALMTAISESATIDEGHLIPSLHAQCVVADTNPNVNPQSPSPGNLGNSGPSTTVPQNVNPKPASPTG
jgi:hypothetical protein